MTVKELKAALALAADKDEVLINGAQIEAVNKEVDTIESIAGKKHKGSTIVTYNIVSDTQDFDEC